MKKFMKAIAFATVMCMLLSTAAFAADLTIADSKVTVTVVDANAEDGEQLALIATKASVASAAAITNDDILDIQQIAFADGEASAELGTKTETSVKIFYGYQSAGVDAAQSFTAAAVVQPSDKVVITNVNILTDAEINDYADGKEGFVLPTTDTDKAGAIIATVDVQKEVGKTIAGMFWSIRHNGANGVAYVAADADLFSVLDGPTQIGLAFSNGNESGLAEVEVTDLHAIVILRDAESNENIIYSDATDFDSNNRN